MIDTCGHEKQTCLCRLWLLQCDHSNASINTGHRSLESIINHRGVSGRTNAQSHFLVSFLHLCVWFLCFVQDTGLCNPNHGVAWHQAGEKVRSKLPKIQTQHKTRLLTREPWPTRNHPSTSSRNQFHLSQWRGDHRPSDRKVLRVQLEQQFDIVEGCVGLTHGTRLIWVPAFRKRSPPLLIWQRKPYKLPY